MSMSAVRYCETRGGRRPFDAIALDSARALPRRPSKPKRARADALEQRAEDLARENADLHAKLDAAPEPAAPAAEPAPQTQPAITPTKPRFPIPTFTHPALIALYVSFFGAIAATGLASGTMKLAAPIVCPKGYASAIVVLREHGTSRGGTSYTGDLRCAFSEKHRFPEQVDTVVVFGVLFAEYLVITLSVAAIVLLLRKKRRSE